MTYLVEIAYATEAGLGPFPNPVLYRQDASSHEEAAESALQFGRARVLSIDVYELDAHRGYEPGIRRVYPTVNTKEITQ